MIARLALLLLAAAVASAQNLRTEEHVPLDNARGARVLQRMQTKAAAKHTKAAKSVNTEREAFKAHRDALKGDALKGDALKAPARRTQEDFDSPWTQVVMKGSLVTRSRPNSDCSGPVTEITVEPAGNCFSATEGVGTYVSESGELTRSAWLFGGEEGTDDCSSEPVAWFMVGRGVKPCQMLAGEYSSTGPLMGGTVLSGQSVAQSANKEKAGFMVKHYKDEACEGDLLAYTLYREDACHLDIESNAPILKAPTPIPFIIKGEDDRNILKGERRRLDHTFEHYLLGNQQLTTDSTFSYVKVNKCQGNTVYITGYTDSQCTHKSYKAEVDLVEEDAYESFITCRRNVAEHHYYDDEDTDDYMGRQVSGSFSEGTCSG